MDADWHDRNRRNGLIATATVMTVLAGCFVLLRLTSRFILIRNPGVDDYLIIGAMSLTVGYLIDLFIGRAANMGYPMTMITPDNMITILKATLAIEVIYYGIVFFIKTSILFTYLRFAVTNTFRNLCIGTVILHSVFFFICFVVTLAQCRPLYKMWDLTKSVDGVCINTTAFFYSTSAFNIITDIWILGLPIKTLASVHRPRREKVGLFLVFGAGTFAAVASIVRLHTIYKYTEAEDPFRNSLLVNLWSMIEVCIAICCASVPALKPVFSRAQRQRTRALSSSQSQRTQSNHWHFRLGSKDISAEKGGGGSSSNENSQSNGQSGVRRSFEASEKREVVEPPPVRPPLATLTRPGGATQMLSMDRMAEMGSLENSVDSGSMLAFTPLSPPNSVKGKELLKDGDNAGGETKWLSSSGSMIVIQR